MNRRCSPKSRWRPRCVVPFLVLLLISATWLGCSAGHAPPVDSGKSSGPASANEPDAESVALEATKEREHGEEDSGPEGLFPDFPPPPQSELGVDSGEPEGFGLPETDSLPGSDQWVNESSPAGNQEETSIAASPDDPDNLVALFQDDAGGGEWAWTEDGGTTWTMGAGGLKTDPAIAADSRGDFYVTGLTPIEVLKSTDGGATFSSEATLARIMHEGRGVGEETVGSVVA